MITATIRKNISKRKNVQKLSLMIKKFGGDSAIEPYLAGRIKITEVDGYPYSYNSQGTVKHCYILLPYADLGSSCIEWTNDKLVFPDKPTADAFCRHLGVAPFVAQ